MKLRYVATVVCDHFNEDNDCYCPRDATYNRVCDYVPAHEVAKMATGYFEEQGWLIDPTGNLCPDHNPQRK